MTRLFCPKCFTKWEGEVWQRCPHCNGEAHSDTSKPSVSGLSVIAGLLIVGGIGGIVYFMAFFDASAAVSGEDYRVNNFGLLQDRQDGVIVSAAILICGVILAAVNLLRKK